MRWLRALLGRQGTSTSAAGITPERLSQVFAWSRLTNIISKSNTGGVGGFRQLGSGIDITPAPKVIDLRRAAPAYRSDEVFEVPPHLKWYWNPTFAYAALVDGKIEYRFGTQGEAAYWACPLATDPEHIRLIDRMFDAWYAHLDLPDALAVGNKPGAAVDRSNKMALIRRFLAEGAEPAFLHDILGAADPSDMVMWVDWREEDDAIVTMCEALLKTGKLSADWSPDDGLDLLIRWRGETSRVHYPAGIADRDTTLIALNKTIAPDYEIRFIRASGASDTLAFLPLSREDWRALERDMSALVAEAFQPLAEEAALFGSTT